MTTQMVVFLYELTVVVAYLSLFLVAISLIPLSSWAIGTPVALASICHTFSVGIAADCWKHDKYREISRVCCRIA